MSLKLYYKTQQECNEASKNKPQSNERYRNYRQTHFTAGDEQQFYNNKDYKNGIDPSKTVDISQNIFTSKIHEEWSGYTSLNASTFSKTFEYIFQKFKKGIYIKITNNKITTFLPFSNNSFVNEWGDRIVHDPKYNSMIDFLREIAKRENRRFNPAKISKNTSKWYTNNGLLRFENPFSENDSGVTQMHHMFQTLCKNRDVPDTELFINRRDFPILKKDFTEPYENIYDSENLSLLSHNYEKYCPILSNAVTSQNADIPIPTWEDWGRVSSQDGKYFFKSTNIYSVNEMPWEDRIETAVFRGSSTGVGVCANTNPRIKLAELSSKNKLHNGVPLLDCGITSWNLRPRKIKGEKYLKTINTTLKLVGKLTPEQQTKYKYMVNVDGHVSAFRFSLEMNMGSVILKVHSKYSLWFEKFLTPYVHYVPVKADLSDIYEKIKWCKENDDKCQQIVKNCKEFYKKFLCKDGILDYLQKTLVEIKSQTGVYINNFTTPERVCFNSQIINNVYFPETHKSIENIVGKITTRTYDNLQALTYIFNMIKDRSEDPLGVIKPEKELFKSKNTVINLSHIADYPVTIKKSKNIRENYHHGFVGLYGINELISQIPNFAYTIDVFDKDEEIYIVSEYIEGETLLEYLSKPVDFEELIFVLYQVCLALHVAQNHIGFIHWDTLPWNIILKRQEPTIHEYIIDINRVVSVHTDIVPVIIDYGKSHIIHESRHCDFLNKFKKAPQQDVLSIIFNSLYLLMGNNLENDMLSKVFTIMNHITKKQFSRVREIREFLNIHKKYSSLFRLDKQLYSHCTPLEMSEYLKNTFLQNKNISESIFKNTIQDSGMSKLIFYNTLTSDINQKAKNYISHLKNIVTTAYNMKKLKSHILLYDCAQSLDHYFSECVNDLHSFLISNGTCLSTEQYKEIENLTEKLHKRLELITHCKDQKIYTLNYEIPEFEFTEIDFLDVEKIKNMKPHNYNHYDIFHNTVMNVLHYNKNFKLPEVTRRKYIDRIKRRSVFDAKFNIASHNTFIHIRDQISKHNNEKILTLDNYNKYTKYLL